MLNDVVSIIMPSYNCGRFVEEAMAQENLELFGFHSHIGSQIFEAKTTESTSTRTNVIWELLYRVTMPCVRQGGVGSPSWTAMTFGNRQSLKNRCGLWRRTTISSLTPAIRRWTQMAN